MFMGSGLVAEAAPRNDSLFYFFSTLLNVDQTHPSTVTVLVQFR